MLRLATISFRVKVERTNSSCASDAADPEVAGALGVGSCARASSTCAEVDGCACRGDEETCVGLARSVSAYGEPIALCTEAFGEIGE